ncbi:acetyltransferase SAS4-like domain-containing protein [Aspergillus udagawae]|uniref:Something about silencing protein 4 domain-containing protein n=1 Tax=Aspergillus udagawae TaxID=91492 RepID=A0A8E0QYA8_9EURO|nr:uncharacterized protein Aud_009161 [Aspergillus udagawae]GIC92690.1 hypothetical protein Aud_009161 [Aspergillus udagawae]
MAVRSRSSLRFSVRRDDNASGHDDEHQDSHDDTLPSSPPPAKRPRLQQQQQQQRRQPPSSRRRKSSPDLLDTTIGNSSHRVPPSSKTPQILRQAAHSPVPPPPPRSSTRRPPPLATASDSASSSSSSSSSNPARAPLPGTPHTTGQSHDHPRTPLSASAVLYMRGGGRESPDPLDIISPAPTKTNPKPRKTPITSTPTSTTRSTRCSRLQHSVASDADVQKPPGPTSSRRKPSSANPQTEAQSQPKQEPAHPSPAEPEQRRSLRSKDSNSRLRSELASYFWNYEQILSLDPPKTAELLTENTTIKLIDDLTEPLTTIQSSTPDSESPFGNPLLQLHDCEKISLPEPEPSSDAAPGDVKEEDPLNEGYYFRAHRRMERQEKQLRNIERERAQHEKMQLERLLDELKGHDWLRVMGITGVHEHEKKLYEPKRDYFMKEIASLIKKFQIWKEEEKRRKLDKDKPSLRAEISPSTAPTSRDRTTSQKRKLSDRSPDTTPDGAAISDVESDGEPPDPSDVDAWAAHQLQQEARSATAGKRPKPSTEPPRRRKSSGTTKSSAAPHAPASAPAVAKPATPPPPEKPFTSFYAKPHLRDVALSPHRKGRVRLAFGHPIPQMEVREFQPPADILTPEAIDSCRRRRRRMRRESRG